ncbi:MAG: hypothetical protein ABI684_12330 [Nitrospirota bacterium]
MWHRSRATVQGSGVRRLHSFYVQMDLGGELGLGANMNIGLTP